MLLPDSAPMSVVFLEGAGFLERLHLRLQGKQVILRGEGLDEGDSAAPDPCLEPHAGLMSDHW